MQLCFGEFFITPIIALCCAVLCAVCPAGIQDVDSKEPEAVAAYMASNGAATAAAAGARR